MKYLETPVAPNSGAVIRECLSSPANILRAWITCHQVLDQLLADERPDVGMHEDVVESVCKIFDGGLIGGKCDALKDRLCSYIVPVLNCDHGLEVSQCRENRSG